ncbi:hypothetical protein ACI79D_12265 [Geodermatophilus sp. SYSU D00708]
MAEVATSSFVGDPQPVEVFHAGAWFPGELLGWRFDETGTCRVRVRCVVGGLRHTAWTDLAHLRLPTADVPPPADDVPNPPAAVPHPRPTTADEDTGRHPLLIDWGRHEQAAPLPRPRRSGLVDWLSAT